MTTSKNVGIWMDHASAHIMEDTDPVTTKHVASDFTHEVKETSIAKSEKHMHNKEQHEESEYYKTLGKSILNYDDVILFGPTDAKVELLNMLKADHRFSDIKIEAIATDKMTENQEHAFVRDYFSRR